MRNSSLLKKGLNKKKNIFDFSSFFKNNKRYSKIDFKTNTKRAFRDKNFVKNTNTKSNSELIKRISIYFVLVFVLGFGFILILSFIFSSKFFEIKSVSIVLENEKYINQIQNIVEEQKKEQKIFWNQNNLFLFSKTEFIDTVEKMYNNFLYNIRIKKIFPNKITISIDERYPKILFINPSMKFYLDENSLVLSKIKINNNKEDSSNPVTNKEEEVFKDYNFPTVFLDENIDISTDPIKKELISFIINAVKKLPKIGINVSQVKIQVVSDSKLIIKTSAGYEIYFNSTGDLDSQIEYLNLLIKEKIKEDIKNITYIDLRFGSKVYYK